jgi:hypothetical protein
MLISVVLFVLNELKSIEKLGVSKLNNWLMICKSSMHPIRETTFSYVSSMTQKERKVENLFDLQMAHENRLSKLWKKTKLKF